MVAITTYNLEDYIGQALDSVLAQKTDFPFKVVVADDSSTDNTVAIVEGYVKRYPDQIVLLTSERNLGSLANSNRVFDRIQCEYFSFLDGDDYWLTDNRLQRQVDFLDEHKEYSMCGGNSFYLRNGKCEEVMIKDEFLGKSFSFKDFVDGKMPFIHTSSLLVRNTIFIHGMPTVFLNAVGTFEECALRGEDFRRILHLQQAPAFIMDGFFSVYRIHEKGIWQGASALRRIVESAITDKFYAKFFGDQYGGYFIRRADISYASLFKYLIEESVLYPHCRLDEKEGKLLSGYLQEWTNSGDAHVLPRVYRLRCLMLKVVYRFTKLLGAN